MASSVGVAGIGCGVGSTRLRHRGIGESAYRGPIVGAPPSDSVPMSMLWPPFTKTFGRCAVALSESATGPAATVRYWSGGHAAEGEAAGFVGARAHAGVLHGDQHRAGGQAGDGLRDGARRLANVRNGLYLSGRLVRHGRLTLGVGRQRQRNRADTGTPQHAASDGAGRRLCRHAGGRDHRGTDGDRAECGE